MGVGTSAGFAMCSSYAARPLKVLDGATARAYGIEISKEYPSAECCALLEVSFAAPMLEYSRST